MSLVTHSRATRACVPCILKNFLSFPKLS
ncbi:hypothetical protein F383_13938 [Gossypium arboreum]|uniref:Uncharacterized protein n=1 Tax=Gossypium arboreum TaxID=29729 RepID=A0A0B0N5F9_GOSAR|nr:hypothetical protein F383_13938 [Gossypium arboreum]